MSHSPTESHGQHPPPIPGARPVLAVVSDLFFRAKIDEVTRQLGLELRVAKSPAQLERQLANATPAIVFIDLEAENLDTVSVVRQLKMTEGLEHVAVIGFAGHANVPVLQAARQAGADEVMARSGFQTRMPAMLTRIAEAERARAGAV